MKRLVPLLIPLLTALSLLTTGCGRDERFARFAEQAADRQAEQNHRMVELQKEVTEGSRKLVEADAEARAEFTSLHRDLQTERGEIGHQRDALEEERRDIASQRLTDPLIAAAIMDAGMLLACMLPLILCWQLLRRGDSEPGDALVAEVLLEDLMAAQPLLLVPPPQKLLTSETPASRSDGDTARLAPTE